MSLKVTSKVVMVTSKVTKGDLKRRRDFSCNPGRGERDRGTQTPLFGVSGRPESIPQPWEPRKV